MREWIAERVAEGGVAADEAVLHYGDPKAEVVAASRDTVRCALTDMALIRARGPDAAAFLHGQLTNDVLTLGEDSRLAAYCTAQGRAIALFRVLRADPETLLLILPRALLAGVLKRLSLFVLRAKVTLEAADDWRLLGVSGPDAPATLTAAGLPAPPANRVAAHGGVLVLGLPGPHARFVLAGPAEALMAHDRDFSALPWIGREAWGWMDIAAGLPTITPATSEAFVPQMLNLDLLGGIHFRKGCYPGQEIVARTHYLGRLKQRMYRASLADGVPAPTPGATLSAPNLPGQPAGTVVSAHLGPQGWVEMLAVVQIASHDQGGVRLGDDPLTFQDLPYPLAASC